MPALICVDPCDGNGATIIILMQDGRRMQRSAKEKINLIIKFLYITWSQFILSDAMLSLNVEAQMIIVNAAILLIL